MAIALLCLASLIAGAAARRYRRALLATFAMFVVFAGFYSQLMFSTLHGVYAAAALIGIFLSAALAAATGMLVRLGAVRLIGGRRPSD